MIAALGIVLRGASFAFRKAVVTARNRRVFGAAFALSSVLVPYCMGAIVGGIASGRVPKMNRIDFTNAQCNCSSGGRQDLLCPSRFRFRRFRVVEDHYRDLALAFALYSLDNRSALRRGDRTNLSTAK